MALLCRLLLPTEERLLLFEATGRAFSSGELSVSDGSDSSITARFRLFSVDERAWGMLGAGVAFRPLEESPSFVFSSW